MLVESKTLTVGELFHAIPDQYTGSFAELEGKIQDKPLILELTLLGKTYTGTVIGLNKEGILLIRCEGKDNPFKIAITKDTPATNFKLYGI